MGLFSGLSDLVKQFSGEGAASGATSEQFHQLASAAPQASVAGGLAEVFRSGSTPPFAQLASQLFAGSNGGQQASVLNSLVAAVGPEVLSKMTGSSSSPLASLLAGNQAPITPEQAAAVKPEDVQALAEHAEKADPSIVDRLSELYAAHPQLIQGLGAAAMAIAVKHITDNHRG